MGNPYKTENDRTSGNFNACFNYKEDKPKFYQVKKEMDHALDIIPYTITSKNNSFVVDGDMNVGDKIHMLDYYVHRNIGPQRKTVICPSATSGKACPICEEYERVKAAKGYDSKEAKALKNSRRVAYNIIDAEDEKEAVQIFDVSYHLFTKKLIDEAKHYAKKHKIDELDYAGIFDPKDAMTVECRNSMEKKGGFDVPEYTGFGFVPRENSYKGVKPYPLDEYMVLLSYDELETMMAGGTTDDEEEEEERPRRRKEVEDDEEEAPRRSRRPKDEDEDNEDDTPRRSRRRNDEDDEDEEEAAKEECPHGLKFGKDYDTEKVCNKCEVYSECRAEHKKSRN